MEPATLVLLTAGGGLIGFLLSVLGAGGSILLLPLLVTGAGLSTREAVPLSLLVVMLLALGNLGPYLRRGQFAVIPAIILGMPALAGSWIGGSWVRAGYLSEPVELGVFAAAALVASWLLTRRRASHAAPSLVPIGTRPGSILPLAIQGVLVGLLTGIAQLSAAVAAVPLNEPPYPLTVLNRWAGGLLPPWPFCPRLFVMSVRSVLRSLAASFTQ